MRSRRARYLEGSRSDMLFDRGKAFHPLERLKGHFKFLSERLIEQGFERGCMLGLFAAEMAREYPKMREELRLRLKNGVVPLKRCCARRRPELRVDPRHDPGEMARFLVNAWEGCNDPAQDHAGP